MRSDRVIVKICFGGKTQLLAIKANFLIWKEDLYDAVSPLCVALTNFDILKRLLRQQDGLDYTAIQNSLLLEGVCVHKTWVNQKHQFRKRPKRRLDGSQNQKFDSTWSIRRPPFNIGCSLRF